MKTVHRLCAALVCAALLFSLVPAPTQARPAGEQPISAAAGRAPLTGAQDVAAGYAHTCVVTADKGVQCWGDNDSGQLGDGTTVARLSLADVINLSGPVQAVTAGRAHTCALLEDGSVQCWGSNESGQLGPAAAGQPHSAAPVQVFAASSGVTSISSGDNHTCALAAGGVRCWGDNSSGQLGGGVMGAPSAAPVQVTGLPPGSNMALISAGAVHTCAADAGSLFCWGSNSSGQLGGVVGAPSATPVQVAGLPPIPIEEISAGDEHSCVLMAGGPVLCWGRNDSGQSGSLAPGPPIPIPMPVFSLSGPRTISAGGNHTCAMTMLGVQCWGSNEHNLLGAGLAEGVVISSSPARVLGLDSSVQKISAGPRHTCVLTSGGGVKCWGLNNPTVLGTGRFLRTVPIPLHVESLPSAVTSISLGDDHTCAILDSGALACWGSSESGQLGDRLTYSRYLPASVLNFDSGVTSVAAGAMHTCAVRNGNAYCWGDNGSGQLGNTTSYWGPAPAPLSVLIGNVTAVAAGFKHSCAVQSGGAQCWGDNGSGQLGDGTTTGRYLPMPVLSLDTDVTAIAAGHYHTCAVQNDGVRCWGANADGQLGVGDSGPGDSVPGESLVPLDVSLPSTVTAIVAGIIHTCALTAGDGVFCWGNNDYGQLGDGSTGSRSAPVGVVGLGADANVTAIAASETNTCALRADGSVFCWGDNSHKQLNADTGGETYSAIPLRTAGLPAAAQDIGAGYSHVCAVSDGSVYCWGDNDKGQAGQPNGAIASDVLAGAVDTYPVRGRLTLDGAPLAGATVTAGSQTSVTDSSGAYELPLPDGSFTVTASKPGYTFSPAGAEVTLPRPNPAEAVQVDFSAEAIPYSVSGRVTLNGAGLAGVTVAAGGRTTATDGSGAYSIANLTAGDYAVTASKPGYTFDPAARQVVLGPDAANIDFTARAAAPPTFTLSGRVTLDGAGLAGVTLSTGSHSTTSNANGTYSIPDLAAGSYTVAAARSGYSFDPATRQVTLGPDAANIDFTARPHGAPSYSISGKVALASGAGLAGATVSAGGQSAATAADGSYAIAGLPAGDYTVTAAKSGYSFDPATRQVALGPDAADVNFSAQASETPGETPLYAISGRVTLADGAGLPGVTVSAGGQSAATAADGSYAIAGLPAGSYTVTAAKSGYTFDPATRQVALGPDAAGVNFSARPGETPGETPAERSNVYLPAIQN